MRSPLPEPFPFPHPHLCQALSRSFIKSRWSSLLPREACPEIPPCRLRGPSGSTTPPQPWLPTPPALGLWAVVLVSMGSSSAVLGLVHLWVPSTGRDPIRGPHRPHRGPENAYWVNERTSDRHINNHICGRVWKPGKSSLLKKANLSGKPLKGTSKNQRRVHHRPGELVRNAAS